MNQLINQGMNTASSADAPMKRKRGRPRKDENQSQAAEKLSPVLARPLLRPLVASIQGQGSNAVKPTAAIASKGKDSMQLGADQSTDDDYNNDEMVGQVVTGVLERAFDAGYFLRVRVGNSNIYMRGVVFKEGCVVPVTPENDIAPNAKMYKRRDIPIPVSFTPQVLQTSGGYDPRPRENVEKQLQPPPPPPPPPVSVRQKEGHNVVRGPHSDKQPAVIPSNSVHQQENLDVDDLSNVASEKQEGRNTEALISQDQNTGDMVTVEDEVGEDEKELELSAPAEKVDQVVVGQDNAPNRPDQFFIGDNASNPPDQFVTGKDNASNPPDQFVVGEDNASNPPDQFVAEEDNALNPPGQTVLGEDNASNPPGQEGKAETEQTSEVVQESEDFPGLQDLSEPPQKLQKVIEATMTYTNGKQLKYDASDENSGKSEEADNTTVLPMETVIAPDTDFALNEAVAIPTMLDQKICGNPGFQISMENMNNDDTLA